MPAAEAARATNKPLLPEGLGALPPAAPPPVADPPELVLELAPELLLAPAAAFVACARAGLVKVRDRARVAGRSCTTARESIWGEREKKQEKTKAKKKSDI